MDELITITDAELLAGVERGSIYHAIAAGRVRAAPLPEGGKRSVGRRTRLVYREDVERLRDERARRLRAKLEKIC